MVNKNDVQKFRELYYRRLSTTEIDSVEDNRKKMQKIGEQHTLTKVLMKLYLAHL